jgi:hypothetical protein
MDSSPQTCSKSNKKPFASPAPAVLGGDDGAGEWYEGWYDAFRSKIASDQEDDGHRDQLAENRRIEFRIGINLGDVIDEENRIYGDGVNVAARLEALADPEGICCFEDGLKSRRCSSDVYLQ